MPYDHEPAALDAVQSRPTRIAQLGALNKIGLSGPVSDATSLVQLCCNLRSTRAVGDEFRFMMHCPHFRVIRAQHSKLFRDAEDSMLVFKEEENHRGTKRKGCQPVPHSHSANNSVWKENLSSSFSQHWLTRTRFGLNHWPV